MMDSATLKKYQAELKKQLTAEKPSELVQRLFTLHANRIDDGISRGLSESRKFKAIDIAYDVTRNQINPTLMRDLVDRNPTTAKEALSLAKSWGLESMLVEVADVSRVGGKVLKGSEGKPGYLLQAPIFNKIEVPLLSSYLKMRWAKLWNDRNVYPLYPYDPLVLGKNDRAAAKVVTGRVARMTAEMNYRAVERDCIHKMLLYGRVISFPKEAWYREQQKVDGKKKTIKEGIRWEIPHPTRVGCDMTHPLYTLNSDTGVEWIFYWNMNRYGDIITNKNLWLETLEKNKGKKKDAKLNSMMIPTGWRESDAYTQLYQQFYPCTAKFPSATSCSSDTFANNRTKRAFLYNADTLDAGIDTTVFFHKLIPKDWGLYDYEYPVWHRFLYVGNFKCLYCEPLQYTPGVAHLYDYDAERAQNSSLGFELMPFQDHMGNLLSQYLLCVKKNLVRIIAINKDVVGKDFVTEMSNFAENAMRGFELFPYSGEELRDQNSNIADAFHPIPLQAQNSSEVIGAMNSIVGMLERVLGYSPQEVGASASHQQSATEVGIIAGSSSTRMNFTGGFVDDALYARKKILYNAMMAYADDEILLTITDMTPDGKAALETMGFKIEDDGEDGVMSVKGSKKLITMESFFSERDGASRSTDASVAQMLGLFLQSLMQNPRVGAELPLKHIFKFFNQIAEYLGLPPELKLDENVEVKTKEEQAKQMEQLQQAVMQIVEQQVGPAIEQISKAVGDTAGQLQQKDQEVEEVLTQVVAAQQQQGQAIQANSQQDAQLAQAVAQNTEATRILMATLDKLTQVAASPVA